MRVGCSLFVDVYVLYVDGEVAVFPTTWFMFTDSVNSDNSHIDGVKFLCPCKVLSN